MRTYPTENVVPAQGFVPTVHAGEVSVLVAYHPKTPVSPAPGNTVSRSSTWVTARPPGKNVLSVTVEIVVVGSNVIAVVSLQDMSIVPANGVNPEGAVTVT